MLKFLKNVKIDHEGCWLFQKDGKRRYGRIMFSGSFQAAHRVSFQIFKGPIPSNLHVLHTCDKPRCVNPEHLYSGTHQDNMRDRTARKRLPSRAGVKNHNVKLKESEVIKIRQTEEKITHTALAKIYEISPEMISLIRRGKAWQNLKQHGGYHSTV